MALASRLRRTVNLARLTGDVARARVASTPQNRKRVAERMGALHGLPQKVGQILALGELQVPDPSYAQLTEGPPVLGYDAFCRELEARLDAPVSQNFAYINIQGTSASLGQVHRARLHDGRTVAVKLQYPGIAEEVRQDLQALGLLALPLGGFKRGFDVDGYKREVGRRLEEELDYLAEMRAMRAFHHALGAAGLAQIPEPVEALCRKDVLVATWIDGASFQEVPGWTDEERTRVGEHLLRAFLTGTFVHRLVHADPHPGNYRFFRWKTGPSIGLLDFGCVKTVPENSAAALLDVIRVLIAQSGEIAPGACLDHFTAMGFGRGLLEPLAERLPDLARALFEPFLTQEPFDAARWNLGQKVSDALGEMRWQFRVAGSPELIYVMRSWQGLLKYLSALNVALRWQDAFTKITHTCPGNVTPAPEAAESDAWAGRWLRIRICEATCTKADLTLPADAVLRLRELMPVEAARRMAERCIDVDELGRTCERASFPAGPILEFTDGAKQIRVWLE